MTVSNTQQLLTNYIQQKPEIVFKWNDRYSEAKGILVINSLKNGACGGGTRVSETLDQAEMTKLAKIMELKFSLYQPHIGGAKSGIILRPDHPQKYEILQRWFMAIRPLLQECYGTASDLNTDFTTIEAKLAALGIKHPQQGIIFGHKSLCSNPDRVIEHMAYLRHPVKITNEIFVPVSKLITGFTIAEAIKSYYVDANCDITNKTAYVQGVGNVGAATAYYLAKYGVKVVALSDKDFGCFSEKGFSESELSHILQTKRLQGSVENLLSHKEFDDILARQKIDLFVPAAGPHLIDKAFISRMMENGLEIMVSGSNIPFNEDSLHGEIAEYVDQRIALIPGFVASGGMARAFYAVMNSSDKPFSYQDIFDDTANRARELIVAARRSDSGKHMAAHFYREALNVESTHLSESSNAPALCETEY